MLKSKRNLLAALFLALLTAGCKEEEEVITPPDPPVLESLVLDSNIKTKTVLENRIEDPSIPDYLVNANVLVTAELEIRPGVVIAFARDTRLEVNDGGGVLRAKGDSLHPIRLVGKEASKGFWAGIQFRSASSANELDYVQVLHAGSRQLGFNIKSAMVLTGNSKANIAIRNSAFEQSGGYGLHIDAGAKLAGFEKNTFKNNTEAGILIDAENVKNLDYNSVFTGNNGRNVVEIVSSAMKKNLTAEAVWAGFKDKTPYRILEQLSVEANWKLMPGVTIEMSRGARITLDDGYLNARGTAAPRISIRGVENTPGYWRGLICFSTSEMNVFEYADISGGGSTALVSGKKTNIAVHGSQARMSIKNSKIANSTGYGIFVNYQASVNDDIETVNTFEGNAEGKLFKE